MMPLVEIIRHDGMAAETEQRLAGFCKAIDKLPVPVTGTPGFLVNRVLFPYMLEAVTAYSEGIPGAAIDKAAVKFGMPMGPIELVDTVGLDVAAGVGNELAPFLGLPIPAALSTPPEAGKRGKKDGQGLYKWENGKAVKPELPKDYQAPSDLEDRLILPLLNEAVACLHDGVVSDADLLDAGVIFGTGFAPFRGGPIQYIRQTGADALLERLKQLHARYGDRFAPRPGWDSPALRDLIDVVRRHRAPSAMRAATSQTVCGGDRVDRAPRNGCGRRHHIVCVARSALSVPASRASILFLIASPSAVSANCTPMPAGRLPCAPAGVTQTTLPATGWRSLDSGRVSSRNTSSPRK